KVKNTAGSKNKTGAADQKVLLSLPSRSNSLPNIKTGRPQD
ncbi:hypothetical protein N310_05514, partial [Acanthisitta chloris]